MGGKGRKPHQEPAANDQTARDQGYGDPFPWYNKMNLTFWMLDRWHMLP